MRQGDRLMRESSPQELDILDETHMAFELRKTDVGNQDTAAEVLVAAAAASCSSRGPFTPCDTCWNG